MAFVTSHGTDIYYEVHGEGEKTLVFAHGMGGNAAIWFNQLAHFGDRYRIVTFDHRYFARSSCAVDDFNPAWFPDDIIAVMDAADVESAVFVCQSMGGWTGSQVALRARDRIDALVMSHTPGVFEHASAVNDRRAVTELVSKPTGPFGSAALAADYPEKNPVGAVLYNQVSAFNGIDPSAIPRKIGEANLGVNTDTLISYDLPTVFISADKDILFPAAYIQALAASVPGATFCNLGDAGHSSYFEIPDAFNQAVTDFIESLG